MLILAAGCQSHGAGPVETGQEPGDRGSGSVLMALSPTPRPDTADEPGPIPTATLSSTATNGGGISSTTQPAFGSCSDNLTFLEDLTYPDHTPAFPGQALEKKWKVRNSGSCDWGPEYSFRWVEGAVLSTRQVFALYPATAGSEAVLSVLLTAPFDPGEYVSHFRAFTPLGDPFGDTLYIDVVVG